MAHGGNLLCKRKENGIAHAAELQNNTATRVSSVKENRECYASQPSEHAVASAPHQGPGPSPLCSRECVICGLQEVQLLLFKKFLLKNQIYRI